MTDRTATAGLRLAHSVVVLTSASSGIGRATTLALAASGARLMLAARGREALELVAAECASACAKVATASRDVGSTAHAARCTYAFAPEVRGSVARRLIDFALSRAPAASRSDGNLFEKSPGCSTDGGFRRRGLAWHSLAWRHWPWPGSPGGRCATPGNSTRSEP